MTVISELAKYFDQELQRTLPITILPNGALGYHNFLIKKIPNNNWGVFNVNNKELINQYYLKSCALMAAKFYNHNQFHLCHEVKDLDNKYCVHHTNSIMFKFNIENASDEKYSILETRLHESLHKATHFKKRISMLFNSSFR